MSIRLCECRLAHTTAMVESWPGAKSLSVFFDVNEARIIGSFLFPNA